MIRTTSFPTRARRLGHGLWLCLGLWLCMWTRNRSQTSFSDTNIYYHRCGCAIVYLALEITYWSWAKRVRLSIQSAFVRYVTCLYQNIISFCVVNDFHCAIVYLALEITYWSRAKRVRLSIQSALVLVCDTPISEHYQFLCGERFLLHNASL